jgi:hypothetical protein
MPPPRTPESKHGSRQRADASKEAAFDPTALVSGAFAHDIARGRWDIEFFAARFLGVTLHPGQIEFAHAVLMRDMTGWRPRYFDIALAAGNRAGKTLIETICHFHSTFYKLGLPPPRLSSRSSLAKWTAQAYEWYHLAIAQETSELAYIELRRLLQGNHEAQKNGCPLTQELGPQVVEMDKKYRSEYLWAQIHPVFGGGTIHYRTTGEKAIGSLGKDMNGISYDECGFDPNFEFVVNEVLHMRRLSTGGQLWLVGTATEGLTAFADAWYEGDPTAPDRKQDKMSLRMSTRQNVGFGIDEAVFDRLVSQMPVELVPQNIDGEFLEGKSSFFAQSAVDAAFVEGYPLAIAALPSHRYVQGVDPALTFDSTWSIVLDVTNHDHVFGVNAQHQTGRTTGPVIAALVTNQHMAYTGKGVSCMTGVDTTGFGGALFRDSLPIPIRSVEFGGTRGKKLKLLIDLKRALETSKVKFPREGPWLTLRRQLLGYRLDDKKLQTDAVMALAVAWSMVKFVPANGVRSAPFDYFGASPRGVQSRVSSGPPTAAFGSRVATYSSVTDMERRRG